LQQDSVSHVCVVWFVAVAPAPRNGSNGGSGLWPWRVHLNYPKIGIYVAMCPGPILYIYCISRVSCP